MIKIIRHRLVRFLAICIGLEAVVVMTGWFFGIDQLTRLSSSGINMKFLTAFLFLFSAIGLYFISKAMRGERDILQTVLPPIVLSILTITVTLFVSRLLGTPTGIEQVFIPQPNPIDLTIDTSIQGWPSFFTLVCFILFGFAGVASLFVSRLGRAVVLFAGASIFFVGFVAVIGYVFQLHQLYYDFSGSAVPMAFNTALLFVLLGSGLCVVYQDTAQNEN
ncbi:MAG: hypothetical protein WAV50_02235 [Minisyncoccia bacterium]